MRADPDKQALEELAGYTYYECRECGFDSTLAGGPSRDECPVCAGDTGRSNIMRTRAGRLSDRPEGRDDAAALRARTEQENSHAG